MKLACAVSTYQTDFGPIIFKDGNLRENFAVMKKYGYSGMDFFIKETSAEQIAEYRKMIDGEGMEVATLFAIYLGECGVKLTEEDPVRKRRNIDLVKRQMEHAKALNALGLGMGFIRGGHGEHETESDALKRIADVLHELGGYANEIGTSILLEPINRYEINTLNSAVQTVDFIRKNDLKGILLQPDMFHMNIEDKSIEEALRHAKDYIGNVHISSSTRHEVGTGHFDFGRVIGVLREIGYNGFLTLEAFSENPEEALRITAENLKPYL